MKPFPLAILAGLLFLSPVRSQDRPEKQSLKQRMEESFSLFLRRDLTIEILTWRLFPLRYTGRNVKLWEKPGVLMAEAPKATLTPSFKTLFAGRLHIAEMRFFDGHAFLRYTHDAETNLTSMIKDLAAHASKNRKPGQRQKVKYNWFRIENATLDVIDAETGAMPFGAPFRVNAKGDIDGLGPQTQFPFRLEAVLLSTAAAMGAEIIGTVSNRPQLHISARKIPLVAFTPYFPVMRWFDGEAKAEFDFSRAGAYKFWKLRFNIPHVRTTLSSPFPTISADGVLHAFVPSRVNVTMEGHDTRFDVAACIAGLRSKKMDLTVKSENADIAEFIRWCHTGYEMTKGGVKDEGPLVWDVRGKADLDAALHSTLGPRLIRDADGQIALRIRNGRLAQMPGFVKALTLLNLSSLLLGTGDAHPGLKFGTVNGLVDINNGIAVTRGPIILESDTLGVALIGRVDFPNARIDARMLVAIASVPENVVNKIPFVRRFADGKKRGVIPLWLAIEGPLDNPTVRLLSLSTFDRTLWKTLPVPFRLPENVIESIYK